jgi:hypothetical protein
MSTEAITIQVDSETASAFNKAPADEQRKMEALVSLWLKEIAFADTRPLKEVMDELTVGSDGIQPLPPDFSRKVGHCFD